MFGFGIRVYELTLDIQLSILDIRITRFYPLLRDGVGISGVSKIMVTKGSMNKPIDALVSELRQADESDGTVILRALKYIRNLTSSIKIT